MTGEIIVVLAFVIVIVFRGRINVMPTNEGIVRGAKAAVEGVAMASSVTMTTTGIKMGGGGRGRGRGMKDAAVVIVSRLGIITEKRFVTMGREIMTTTGLKSVMKTPTRMEGRRGWNTRDDWVRAGEGRRGRRGPSP
jgi:hypothetical protein